MLSYEVGTLIQFASESNQSVNGHGRVTGFTGTVIGIRLIEVFGNAPATDTGVTFNLSGAQGVQGDVGPQGSQGLYEVRLFARQTIVPGRAPLADGQPGPNDVTWLPPTTGNPFGSIEVTPLTPNQYGCLLYTSPSPRDATLSRMPSSA